MAQHDYDIANQSGANFRADLNNALDAIVSNNSGSSEPSTTFAYEWWIDTSANVLKLRNSANNAWITLPLSITADNSTSGALTVNGNLSTTGTLDVNGGEVILDADADTSITADTDDQIDFRVGAVDVMTLTNSHLVLKGTTPKITIGDGGEEDTALIFDGNAQDFYIGLDDTDDFLKIGTGSTIGTNTLVTVENGGNVGIGCDPVGTFQIKTQTDGNAAFQNSTSVTGGVKINCFNDAANASAPFEIDGSSLQFNIASTEKMRLDSSGNLLIGTTSTGFSDQGVIITDGQYVGTMDGSHCMTLNRKSSDGLMLRFFKDESLVGSISTNANSLPSDKNFKRDISDLNLGLNLVSKLKPRQYNYIVDDENSPKMYGLIAQDLEESLTEVGIEKNSTWLLQHNPKDDEKQSDYSLDYTKLIPILINSIQEQQEQIEALQSEINTLKGGE